MTALPFVPAYANWRPDKRIVDRKVFASDAAAELRQRPCAGCGVRPGSQLHHVVSRGGRGDDVIENLIGLCDSYCHDAVHHAPSSGALLLEIGRRLTPANVAYAVGKKGAGWLATRYGVVADDV